MAPLTKRKYGGSSPHTRRTRRDSRGHLPSQRFISAHAENTCSKNRLLCSMTVHLRTRGEHTPSGAESPPTLGSSPHTRRTRDRSNRRRPLLRFISAHAENTLNPTKSSRGLTVHLRTRGEHTRCPSKGRRLVGSSPHTRRTHRHHAMDRTGTRFISAHAENTAAPVARRTPVAVHLRTRGEHAPLAVPAKTGAGSSPHTRRTRPVRRVNGIRRRFISAHAENTHSARPWFLRLWVHLRTRGEHNIVKIRVLTNYGSSPHTRRTPRSRSTR